MKPLCRNCEELPYSRVIEILDKKFGKWSDVFETVYAKPLGVASLAQVHKAVLKNGDIVAIKIQHPRLLEESEGDIKLIKIATKIASRLFPDFKYEWLGEQFELNLPTELDFLNEGRNSEKLNRLLNGNKKIIVPKIYWDLSSKNLLVMTFESGGSIEDEEYLRENNINVREISYLLSKAFNEQIFKHGFVHADPHSGNILVKKTPTDGLQLVFLDHGLYRELDDSFRYHYSNFWRGVIKQNPELIKEACQNLNIKHFELFCSIVTNKSYTKMMDEVKFSQTRFSDKKDSKEKNELREHAKEYHKEITHVLNDVRQEMLLLLKINEYLRAIDRQLGSPVNNFMVMMKIIYNEIVKNPEFTKHGQSKLKFNFEYLWLFALFKFVSIYFGLKSLFSTKNHIKNYKVFANASASYV